MNEHAGTPTDPVWWYVVLAFIAATTLLLVFVLADSILRVLVRKAQQRRALARWQTDVEARSSIGGWVQ